MGPAETVCTGSLLVAAPGLDEPTFRRTVIYLVSHDDTGTVGVVLNRPSEGPVVDVLPAWAPHAPRPAVFFLGGPVKRDGALGLATLRTGEPGPPPGVRAVQGRVVLVDLDAPVERLAPHLDGVRVFLGYAGWGAGQLAGELARGDWLVVPSLPSDVLTPGRVDLWGRVLRRQPMPLALLASHPGETSRN